MALRVKQTSHKLLDQVFDVGIILKGLDGVLEMIGGVILIFAQPASVNHLVHRLTLHELSTDPHDFFATHLVGWTAHIVSAKVLSVLYLLGHGGVKVLLVLGLLTNHRRAFEVSMGFMILFIAYESYRIGLDHSLAMFALVLFDLAVTVLIWQEYLIRFHQPKTSQQ